MFALGFAISLDGIAAQTPTQMQGSEVKEINKITVKIPNRMSCHCNRSDSNHNAQFERRMALPLHYRENVVFNS